MLSYSAGGFISLNFTYECSKYRNGLVFGFGGAIDFSICVLVCIVQMCCCYLLLTTTLC